MNDQLSFLQLFKIPLITRIKPNNETMTVAENFEKSKFVKHFLAKTFGHDCYCSIRVTWTIHDTFMMLLCPTCNTGLEQHNVSNSTDNEKKIHFWLNYSFKGTMCTLRYFVI